MRDFGYLNKIVKEHRDFISTFYEEKEYLEKLKEIFTYSNIMYLPLKEYYQREYSSLITDEYKKGESLSSTISRVSKFLSSIDKDYKEIFLESIEDGTIQIQNKKELKRKKVTLDNFYEFSNVAGIKDGRYLINVILNNTIQDSFLLVHEFTHYLSMSSLKDKTIDWFHLTEGYAKFMELELKKQLSMDKKLEHDLLLYEREEIISTFYHLLDFRHAFIYYDIVSEFGSFTPKKVYKYAEGNIEYANQILKSARMFPYIDNREVKEYLEDSRYVFATPFALCLMEDFHQNKEKVKEELQRLEEFTFDYFFLQYDLEEVDLKKYIR